MCFATLQKCREGGRLHTKGVHLGIFILEIRGPPGQEIQLPGFQDFQEYNGATYISVHF